MFSREFAFSVNEILWKTPFILLASLTVSLARRNNVIPKESFNTDKADKILSFIEKKKE